MAKSASQRREESNNYIKSKGICCLEELPLVEESKDVKLKDLDTICKKAISTILTIQVVGELLNNGDFDKTTQYFLSVMDHFGVTDYMNGLEQYVMAGKADEQDLIACDWEYEIYWSLLWALGFDVDLKDAANMCDCGYALDVVYDCKNYEEFKSKCKLRDIEEILDMLDLFYRFHWATTEKRVNPDTPIGDLNPEIVVERRRGLEWLVSKEEDWYEISLDT